MCEITHISLTKYACIGFLKWLRLLFLKFSMSGRHFHITDLTVIRVCDGLMTLHKFYGTV